MFKEKIFFNNFSSLLKRKEKIELTLKGYLLALQPQLRNEKFAVSTTLISQKDYIPLQVKKWIEITTIKDKNRSLPSLQINEEEMEVFLYQKFSFTTTSQFVVALKSFVLQAQRWSFILNDLY